MIQFKQIQYVLCLLLTLCFIGCKEEDPYFVSMNTQEKYLFIGDQFMFNVTQQGHGADNSSTVQWSVSDTESLRIDSITSKGLFVTALKVSNDGITVRGELSNGRYVLAQVFIQQRMAGDSDLSFASTEIYMAAGTTDSIVLVLGENFLNKFPNVSVRSSNPDLLSATLQITDSISYVKLRTLSSEDGEAIITVSAGEKEINCKVNVGVYLYLSFADINLSLGKPQIVPKQSLTFLVNSNKPANSLDTIKVYYLATPDDETHLEGIQFKVSTAGEHGILWIKGFEKKYVDNKFMLYVYVETSENKGVAQVIIESLGNKVVADVDVMDKNDIQVKKIKFKKEEYNTETNLDLFTQLTVDPLSVISYWPLSWSVSNTEAATINSDGFLTIHKAGTVVVTATVRGVSGSCTVNSMLRVLSVSLPDVVKTYAVGEKDIWTPIISANFTSIDKKYISWKSSNTSVATVDNNGQITAVSSGTAEITVTVVDDFEGTYSFKREFKVSDYNIFNLTFNENDYLYYADRSGTRLALDVYLEANDRMSYYITLNLKSGSWDLTQNRTYTFGTDLKEDGAVTFGLEGTEADIRSGSITVNNGVITFDLVAAKGSKSITIKGGTSPE